ncbi:PAS domain-containing sensor histidine kinase [Roseimaritima ulvae]|uniref:histidine kinase n=1 Tax=Roseimaritima ulvae TaxID=980254 RepID=A0A5B9QWQ1_9BACT|nr:ATP-binding protein [Roseimaritima ulvae]QEG43478.1 Alkaline phosphatase synthesis sensor protein PhoR [Roseimaritima ulvae]
MPSPTSNSLTHRLVDRHLAFGLACVFAGTVAIHLTLWQGDNQMIAGAVAVPLGVLLVGGWMLRNVTRVPGSIEGQLRNLAEQTAVPLQPLKESGPVAAGWNSLLSRLNRHDAAHSLADRLTEAFCQSGGSRWEAAFMNLPDGFAITNESGTIEACNPALLRVLRLPSDQAITGRNLQHLLQQWTGETDNPALQQLAQSSCKITCELRCGSTTAEGVLRVARCGIADSQDSGTSQGLVWNIRDNTQQRLSEEMRNEFVFTATHELRTPLANIKAYAETLTLDMDLDIEKQKGFFNIINAEATRLARFIDELLDVSQMESGSMGVVRHETDLERLLQEVFEHVQPQARKQQLELESVLPPKLPKVQADKDKLAAAMVNLLGNAIKYTPQGGQVRLKVEQDKQYVHLQVEDTGIGIHEDEISRIGEKFFRCHDERIQDIPGSGLGVAFAQEVARLHGGKLSIRSQLNEGSQFTLSLPAAREAS